MRLWLLRIRAAVLGIRALHAGHERRIAAAALFGLGWTWLLMRGGLFSGLLLAYAIAIYPIQAYNCSSAPCISSSVPVVYCAVLAHLPVWQCACCKARMALLCPTC